MFYDVIIIGAGPSGLFAGLILEQNNLNYCILEQGKNYVDREKDNYYDVGFGVGGSGLFSDGKVSYFPSASKLWSKLDHNILEKSYNNVKNFLEFNNIQIKDWDNTWINYNTNEKIFNTNKIKVYYSEFLDKQKRFNILKNFHDYMSQRISCNSKVRMIKKDKNIFVVECDKDKVYYSKYVIIATGKSNYMYLFDKDVNLFGRYKNFWGEMGIRVEVNAKEFLKLLKDVKEKQDYKIINDVDNKTEVRTFCFCDDGVIRKSLYDESHITFNGEHIEQSTNKANIGIVLRTNDVNSVYASEIIKRFELNKTEEMSLEEYRFKNKFIVGDNVDKYLKQMLNNLFDNDVKGKVVGPEIEKMGEYFKINESLSVIDGLYFVGDCTTLFRGLMPAFISGCYVANIISHKLNIQEENLKKTIYDLNIKCSNTDKMKLIFTAQSKVYFYCRDVICEYVFKQGYLPINPFRVFDYFLNDRVDRDIIRRANNQLVDVCEELWVFGNIANGVLFEITRAISLNKNIRFFTIGTDINDIQEISVDNIKFEPEVHAKQIKKANIINFIKNKGDKNNISNQMNLF